VGELEDAMVSTLKEKAPDKPQHPAGHMGQRIRQTRANMLDAVDNGLHAAKRAVRKRKMAAQDLVDGAALQVRHRPLQSLGVALAAGMLIGAVVMRLFTGSAVRVEPEMRRTRLRV
jgi:ElaB/YqjD/DUF883 family membrane-anchored ribosome-binding protein